MVYATFVFGYDHDSAEVFKRTVEFAIDQRLFMANFNHLQPFPGTTLNKRLSEDGRLLHEPWWLDPTSTNLTSRRDILRKQGVALGGDLSPQMQPVS